MNNTNNIPQETVNSILIDILKGSKEVSSEIYGASKTAIIKAVDFAQEQSPLVVQEFLFCSLFVESQSNGRRAK